MKSFVFNGRAIATRQYLGDLCFNADDVRAALGYSSISGIKYHVTPMDDRDKTIWLGVKQLSTLAKKATRNKYAKSFYKEATVYRAVYIQDNISHTFAPTADGLFSVADVAKYVGMGNEELQEWLVAQGFCGRYDNGNLKLNRPFRDCGYAKKPIAASGKESNVVRLTVAGKEYIKNRLESARQVGVLSFANATRNEEVKLEGIIDDLITSTFLPFVYQDSTFGVTYVDIDSAELNKKIKEIIAQIKLKE